MIGQSPAGRQEYMIAPPFWGYICNSIAEHQRSTGVGLDAARLVSSQKIVPPGARSTSLTDTGADIS
jgi:hypothetical protein